jgi:hypothetical protein
VTLKYRVLCPVWGRSFITRFLHMGLPTQLAPGNLPALPAGQCVYHVFTPAADAKELRRSPVFQALQKLMPTVIEPIDYMYLPHSYAALVDCFNRGLERGCGEDCAFLFLQPDVLWSDGSLAQVHRHLLNGKRAVLLAAPRVSAEGVRSRLEPAVQADGRLTLTGRELTELLLQHMHHLTRTYIWGPEGVRGVGQFFWLVGSDAMLIRTPMLHPLAVRPVDRSVRLWRYIDGDFVGRSCPNQAEIHVVTDSDEICAAEFSEDGYQEGIFSGDLLPMSAHLKFLDESTDAQQRETLRRYIWMHAGTRTPQWNAFEEQSDRVVDELLRAFAEFRSQRRRDGDRTDPGVCPDSRAARQGPFIRVLRKLSYLTLQTPITSVRIGPLDPALIRPEQKHAYIIDLNDVGIFAPSDKDHLKPAGRQAVSRLAMLEDGKPLGPPHQEHPIIRNKGKGAYSHWGNGFYFSTSDNSDPRTNGRAYTIVLPLTLEYGWRRLWWKSARRLRRAA